MPLVRISLAKGRSAGNAPEYRRQVGDAIHRALVETIDVPPADRFQLITEHEPDEFIYDPRYLGIERSDDLVIVQITISAGRSLEKKRALFRRIADNLTALGVRREDVWVNLVEVAKENWSFGNGEASYAAPELQLKHTAPAVR